VKLRSHKRGQHQGGGINVITSSTHVFKIMLAAHESVQLVVAIYSTVQWRLKQWVSFSSFMEAIVVNQLLTVNNQ
jgi:hypothetical protein